MPMGGEGRGPSLKSCVDIRHSLIALIITSKQPTKSIQDAKRLIKPLKTNDFWVEEKGGKSKRGIAGTNTAIDRGTGSSHWLAQSRDRLTNEPALRNVISLGVHCHLYFVANTSLVAHSLLKRRDLLIVRSHPDTLCSSCSSLPIVAVVAFLAVVISI